MTVDITTADITTPQNRFVKFIQYSKFPLRFNVTFN